MSHSSIQGRVWGLGLGFGLGVEWGIRESDGMWQTNWLLANFGGMEPISRNADIERL